MTSILHLTGGVGFKPVKPFKLFNPSNPQCMIFWMGGGGFKPVKPFHSIT